MPHLWVGVGASWPGRLERWRNGAELRAESERHPATIASRRDGGDAADRAGVHWLGSCARSLTAERGEGKGREGADTGVPEPDGALLRPLAVARCDLDLPMAMAGLFPGPFAVGHETVADVVAVGDAVRDRKPGDRALV